MNLHDILKGMPWSAARHAARRVRALGRVCAIAIGLAPFVTAMPGIAQAQNWTPVPQSGFVTGVAVAPDGTLVGVGKDTLLYTRASLTGSGVKVSDSGSVIEVAFMPDGRLLGVGTDRQLYTRATLTSAWNLVPRSGSVIGVTVMPDGTVVGVGTDQLLWTRATLDSDWKQVPRSGAVTAIAAMPGGALVGVGTDKALWTRSSLTGDWVQVAGSGSVVGVAVLADGRLLGVGVDHTLWTREKPVAPSDEGAPAAPWVARSFTGNLLPLASRAEVWSNPKLFKAAAGDMTVQSRFMGQKGTTCRFEVQFNNVGPQALDRGIVLSRPGKAEVSRYDTVLRARLAPGASVAYGTEVRECPLNWGETQDLSKCAACEPMVYFVAQ